MATHFERLMAAQPNVHEKVEAVVRASTPLEEAEARKQLEEAEAQKEDVIKSLPPRMRQQVAEVEAQLE